MTQQGSNWRKSEPDIFEALTNRGRNKVPAALAASLSDKEVRQCNLDAASQPSKPMSLRTLHGFPTRRRPQLRALDMETDQEQIDAWFAESEISVGTVADTPERIAKVRRMLYTWRDCFAKTMCDVKATDLIEHSIDLTPNAKPVYTPIKRYNPKEKAFAARIFPEMEAAGIILRAASDWGARSLFPPKKKGSDDLRVVQNFIPLNKCTIKPQYPMHRIDEVLDTLIKPRFFAFFCTDAANGYWAILIKDGHQYRAGFVTPHGQYIYLRMGQGLTGACATYAQFTDLVFGPMPAVESTPAMQSMIGDHGNSAFCPFVDDHMGAATDFDSLFDMLHTKYFPRVAFGPVYLSGHKTHVFTDSLEMVGFTGGADGLRPSVKHRQRAMTWKEPTNRAELDAIIWITPFLRMFIPGRAEHVIRLKKAYLKEEAVQLESGSGKSVRRKWVEKSTFDWGDEQRQSFLHIQKSISENAMSGLDENLQVHLATDASKFGLGGVLFQLPGEPAGTEAVEKHKSSFRIVMFLSFKLEEAETRYHTTEREALAVVRCMAEVKCFVMGHKFPTMIYTDHQALESIMSVGTDAHGRIARWMDRLTEYDYVVHHRPSKAAIMGLADGMSRMPGRYSQPAVAEDSERVTMALATISAPTKPSTSVTPVQLSHMKYRKSKWYGRVTSYLLDGPESLKKCGKTEARNVKRLSPKYRLTDQHVIYLEKGGEPSKCALPEEVSGLLKWAHDEHGHFQIPITLHKLRGQWYWPTRTSDIEKYCRTCRICQMEGPRKKSTTIQSIAKFHPFAMVGMDFLGPISPRCEVTGFAYVLIVVDYFSRFVWAKGCVNADQEAVHDLWVTVLAPTYGFPESLYTDNGKHFVGSEIISLFESHGTYVTQAPISHPSTVGLSERNVQLVLAQIRKWVYEKGPQSKAIWGRALPQIMPNINSRLLRIQGFTPAEILMGYNPQWNVTRHGEERDPPTNNNDVTVSAENAEYWQERRKEIQDGVLLALTSNQARMQAKSSALWTPPKPGDLVLVRDFQKEKHFGRKLESNWIGPRLLTEVTQSGVSGYVQELYGEKVKKYHLDDLKKYCARPTDNNATSIERNAMLYAGFPGQRAVDLNSPPYML